MKKITKFLPAIVSFIAFIVLAIVVFLPYNVKDSSNREIFATSLKIDKVSRTIEIGLDSTLHFADKPYTIVPANCNQEVNVKVLDNLGRDKAGANYNNGYFNADLAGLYYLRFYVANAYNGYSHDTIKINVLEEYSEDNKYIEVKKYSTIIYETETSDLNELVDFVNVNANEKMFRLNGMTIVDGIFSTSDAGNFNVEVVISLDGYELIQYIEIVVKEINELGFTVIDVNKNKLVENQTFICRFSDENIVFQIYEPNSTNQTIRVEIENEKIVTKKPFNLPLLILEIKNLGKTKITITSLSTSASFVFYIDITS